MRRRQRTLRERLEIDAPAATGNPMTTQRNIYLQMKTLSEAREILFNRFGHLRKAATESVSTADAVGRTLAAPVFARLSAPHFHAAAMDGIAVRAADTFGASESRPKDLSVGTQALFVNTGHVLPDGYDAVIMIEGVQELGEDRVRIEAPAFPWQHVRKMGEDIVATELLFPRHHVVTPYCVGALLAGGIFSVTVMQPPTVVIIPTGSELVDWRETAPEDLRPGQVLETNATMLGCLVTACGGRFVKTEKIADDPPAIEAAVATAVADGADMVLTVGGSSAGSADHAKTVLAARGEVLVHGVTIMPGKPVLIADLDGTPAFGIPGYPVSAIIAFEQFVQPLILSLLGRPETVPTEMSVVPTRKIPSKLGVEEFLRVKLGRVGDRVVATPMPRGAGCITTITEADGIVRIPNAAEGVAEGETVAATLLRPPSAIDNTIVVVGSHDNTIDLLADQLKRNAPRVSLSSSHVGSMGGLMALRKGVCHAAGTHLLDTETGEYNVSYIRKYLPDVDIRLIQLVHRDQGLIVPRGNPKGIRGIDDLKREDIAMINRQGGSGTRILLDYRLAQCGISPEDIRGYGNEEFTHMSVAVAVLSGAADVGLGIHAAARALGLDFIPVVTEEYDIAIPEAFMETEMIRTLLATIRTEDFKARVVALGGYHTEKTGEEKKLGK
jgi:putative molybdopterin biosynthesis protein